MKTCSVPGCASNAKNVGMCGKHYQRSLKYGDPNIVKRGGRVAGVCIIEGCGKPREGHGYCNRHYLSWRKYGDPLAAKTRRTSGTGSITNQGYIAFGSTNRKLAHVIVAETALGHPLPEGAQVHHINGDRSDNRNENLVICPDQAYHSLLHRRQAAYDACGNPNYRKCWICGEHGNPEVMGENNGAFHHHQCRRERDRKRAMNHESASA